MEIPNVLKNDSIKFCKIRKGTKKPFEEDWTKKPYSWQEIQAWLDEEGSNYGVLCGYGNIAVIDVDKAELQLAIDNIFPNTFRVKTGGGGTHNYFFVPDLKQRLVLEAGDVHLGEVQSQGQQVVGAGSTHPSGTQYELLNDVPIAELTCDFLLETLKPFIKRIKEVEESAPFERRNNTTDSSIDDLRVEDIWGTIGLKKRGNEYFGSHPTHDSTGGMNFWMNTSKNCWHCFRCDSGGGVLSAIAVKHGLINCSEAQRGSLRGDKARQAIEIAKEKYGLKDISSIDNPSGLLPAIANKIPENNVINIIWDKDLQDVEEEQKEWIIDKIIPNKAVCILTGKRGTLKTFIALLMAYSISMGTSFLGNYASNPGNVIYLDKENGLPIMKNRVAMIKKGLETKESYPVGFICFSQLKIDKMEDIWKIEEEVIKKFHPRLLIIDTYRRGISFDENDAGAVSQLFVDILRPMVERNNVSLLLIHHDRKSQGGGNEGGLDEMDMMRGSSDLANYADIILKMERRGVNAVLKQLKNRNAQELEPMMLKINIDDEMIKIEHGGEAKLQTRAEKCAEVLILWINEKRLTSFTTKEAEQIAFRAGIKKMNFYEALDNLQTAGYIEKGLRGVYDVKDKVN